MAQIKLDFSNVKELTNISVGKHVLKVTKVEQEQASTGNPMLKVTFNNAMGEVGVDYFVLTEAAMWKLQILLKALFKTEFKGVIDLNTDTMIGRTCEATAKEEEYMKQDGTPGLRTVLDNYHPVSDAGDKGIAPTPQAAAPAPQAPVSPSPVNPAPAPAPQVTTSPAAVTPPAATTPAPAQTEAPTKAKRPWE